MHSEQSSGQSGVGTQSEGGVQSALNEVEREELRALVSQAVEVIPPNWPLRTFAYRNPLIGFEHLPFHEAVSQAKQVFGGEGYLSTVEYRACYAEGRISEKELLNVLRSRLPELASQDSVRAGERSLRQEEVLLIHFVYGIDPLDPKLLPWQLTEEDATHRIRSDVPQPIKERLRSHGAGGDPEAAYIHSLWTWALKALDLSEDGSNGHHGHSPTTAKAGAPAQAESGPAQQRIRTAAEIIDDLTGSDLKREINEHMIKWCAAFADEGMADWSMPSRGSGFYRAWRDLAPGEAAGWTLGISGWARRVKALPDRPEDALAASLHRLQVPDQQREEYLRRHLTRLPGWAGYIRWRAKNPDYPEQGRHPIDPLGYLAVRLFYEAELAERVCPSELRINPTFPDLLERARSHDLEGTDSHAHGHDAYTETVCRDVWRLFHLAQFLELRPEDLQHLPSAEARSVLSWLDRFPPDALRPVWHEAYEQEYRNALLTTLINERQRTAVETSHKRPRPRAQAAFCIDARSKPFRSHLEAQGEYDTIGFAGFFGTPIDYRKLNREEDLLLCPVLIKPKYVVKEEPRWVDDPEVQRYLLGDRWTQFVRHLFHQAKANPASSYLTFDLFGLVFGLAMLGKTLFVKSYELVRTALRHWLTPPIPTKIPVEKFPEQEREAYIDGNERACIADVLKQRIDRGNIVGTLSQEVLEEFRLAAIREPEDGSHARRQTTASERLGLSVEQEHAVLEELRYQYGLNAHNHHLSLERFAASRFSPAEKAAVVENALRVMSLTKAFARLVLLCGHASTTENNPYASAYHCGACGGNPGGPNARVLAALANKPKVRQELRNQGIEIPEDTWFIAGEHNTTTDQVTLFDLEELPESHHPDVRQLQQDLEAARLLNVQERLGRLPGAPSETIPQDAARYTSQVSRDWAQVRPEWGLSSNAAFIVGRRALTRGLKLDGRVFLHNYDQSQDETGRALEAIMTAPLVVCQMINFQYYFSATDNWAFGSGTKVLHNVVSGVGVMLGRHSDLQTGFPFQSLTTGARRFHEPLRLLAVIEADTERISRIISRHVVLQNFFNNQWLYLVSCHPTTGEFSEYQPGGTWKAVSPPISG
ncbi:MAG: DUF2309 domain-containing protein [Nitrospira sp.]|nr:DUF2309 domain-containing protein [Nitrospira sp.]